MLKISLITPSFSQVKFIRQTIDSVLSQNYPNLEYLVMDGGSADGTVEILKSYGKQITWVSESDHGQADAINKGLKQATGDILGYLNSDDVLLPGSLQAIGKYFANHPDCDWLTGDCIVVGIDGRPAKTNWLVRGYKRFLFWFYSPKLLRIVDNMIPQPSTFWSRKAIKKVGLFNADLHYVMDYDYWLRLSRHYKPHDLKIPLSGFRAQPDSKSETSRDKLMAEGDKVLADNGATKLDLWLHRLHSGVVRFIYNQLKN